MNPQKLVASLEPSQEYARLMKEKGRELPESYFKWNIPTEEASTETNYSDEEFAPKIFTQNEWEEYTNDYIPPEGVMIPALTSGEIGDMLYQAFEETNWDLLYKAYGEVFNFKGTQRIGDLGIINLMRKPDMGLKMLNYLLTNDLV